MQLLAVAVAIKLTGLLTRLMPLLDNPALRSALRRGYILNIAVAIFNLLPIRAAGGFPWDADQPPRRYSPETNLCGYF